MLQDASTAPKCSRAERDLRVLLMKSTLPVTFRFAAREGQYLCDFLFVDWKLCVELDGPFHDSIADAKRDQDLAKMGIVTLRLPFDLPAPTMLEHILYVGGRIKYKPIIEKLIFLKSYRAGITNQPLRDLSPGYPARRHPDCMDCGGNGWKLVAAWSEKYRHAYQAAVRCACTNLRPQIGLELTPEPEITLSQLLYEWTQRKPPQQASLFPVTDNTAKHSA